MGFVVGAGEIRFIADGLVEGSIVGGDFYEGVGEAGIRCWLLGRGFSLFRGVLGGSGMACFAQAEAGVAWVGPRFLREGGKLQIPRQRFAGAKLRSE